MRTHDRFAYLVPKYESERVLELMDVENLVAARFEPVYSLRYEAYMDLLFERADSWLVVPMLRVDGVSLMVPENPPVTWPQVYERFAGSRTEAIEERVMPFLRAGATARFVNDEAIRFFRDEPHLRQTFDAARAATMLGAAPYPGVLKTIAPAAYALRFARNRRAALRSADAGNFAAVLSNATERIDIDSLDSERDALARKWFGGLTLGSIDCDASYGLYAGERIGAMPAEHAVYAGEPIEGERAVQLAEPIPTDVMLSFDTQDAPAALTFSVASSKIVPRSPVVSEPVAGGGSGGRIRLVVRDEAMRFQDADFDAARALERRLRAEGFDAQISIASRVDVSQTDLIHAFDLRHGVSMVELLRDAEAARVPVVVTPYADDRKGEASSGCSGTVLIPRCTNDRTAFDEYMSAFARRKISNLTDTPWYDDVASVLMSRAACAVVASATEAEFLKTRFGYCGTTIPVPAIVPVAAPSEKAAHLVGPDEFVLIHGPLEPRMNQLAAAVAAQREGLPLVVLGAVADVEFYRYLNEVAGPSVVLLRDDDLTEEELAGIYGRARVLADVSWSARGLHRLARGAASGSAVVAPVDGYAYDVWGEMAAIVDPADLESIRKGFRRAWEQQPRLGGTLAARTLERCDPFGSLVAVVSAYQHASAVPA